MERWPEIRYVEVMTEDNRGHRTGGNVRFVEDGREAADGEFTHVMVRLRAPELGLHVERMTVERVTWSG